MTSKEKISLTQLTGKKTLPPPPQTITKTATFPLCSNNIANNVKDQKAFSKINFEILISEFRVTSIPPFTLYLQDIWKDLSDRSEEKGKGLTLLTFSKVKHKLNIY